MQILIEQLIKDSLKKLQHDRTLPKDLNINIVIEHTRNYEHGDYTTNIALALAKLAQIKPLDLAGKIVAHIPQQENIFKIEAAAPGFINFYLSEKPLHSLVKDILEKKAIYGHTKIGENKSAIIEFVSANPTGPLHVGHGRGAAFGDTIANLLETMGYKAHREYYVNDAGRQMHILAVSVWLRYLELPHKPLHFPVNGYKGDYVKDIAKQLKEEYLEKFQRSIDELYQDLPADEDTGGDKEFYIDVLIERAQKLLGTQDYQVIFQAGITSILADISEDLEEFGVVFQEWFHESHLVQNKDIEKAIEKLKQTDSLYHHEGALWFRATNYGDDNDRVLIRSNGQYTYFASDISYHLNKYEREFDLIIDVLGADHHGYAPRIKAFLQALNYDLSKLEILLVQFAILYRGKTKIPMSTRAGEFVTLRDLRNEVGNDATRFFYIMRKNDQHLDFDLELAKSQSADNPVYYIQYAHARIASVINQATEKGLFYDQDIGANNLHLLTTIHEHNLLRNLLRYSITLKNSALNYEPHVLAHYLRDLANDLHSYYNAEQFLVADENLRNARLCLISAVKQILANGLNLLGVNAPDAM